MTTTTRQNKTPRERAQEALGIATRLVSAFFSSRETAANRTRGGRRRHLAKHPDPRLGVAEFAIRDRRRRVTEVDGAGGEES